jgi:hypothetical protein
MSESQTGIKGRPWSEESRRNLESH